MKKKIFITIGVLYVIFSILIIASTDKTNPNVLTVKEYGEKYPYTIDNVELFCRPVDAVYIETKNGEKYALNGLAMNLLKNDPKYKGNTNAILKPTKTDVEFLNKGFELCKK